MYCPAGVATVCDGDFPVGFETEAERDAWVAADTGDGIDIPFRREPTDWRYIAGRWREPGLAVLRIEDAPGGYFA